MRTERSGASRPQPPGRVSTHTGKAPFRQGETISRPITAIRNRWTAVTHQSRPVPLATDWDFTLKKTTASLGRSAFLNWDRGASIRRVIEFECDERNYPPTRRAKDRRARSVPRRKLFCFLLFSLLTSPQFVCFNLADAAKTRHFFFHTNQVRTAKFDRLKTLNPISSLLLNWNHL